MNNEVKAKLAKACPCCGSKDIRMDNPAWLKEHGLQSVNIMCKNCGLEMTGYSGHDYVNDCEVTLAQAYTKALRRWNRRAA